MALTAASVGLGPIDVEIVGRMLAPHPSSGSFCPSPRGVVRDEVGGLARNLEAVHSDHVEAFARGQRCALRLDSIDEGHALSVLRASSGASLNVDGGSEPRARRLEVVPADASRGTMALGKTP